MLSPEKIAELAEEKALLQGPFTIPEEKLFIMLELIRQGLYHVISHEIETACRRKIGL
jgi:hypothetical protein